MRKTRLLLVLVAVTSLIAPVAFAAAGPLDGRIVYSDIWGGSGIYTISPDGTQRVHLITGPGVYRPKWSSDGTGIFFLHEIGASGPRTRFEAVDVDGSNRRVVIAASQLPDTYRAISDYDWSPDGTQLLLSLYGSSGDALFLSSADGTSMTKIADNASSPDWSSQARIVATRNGRLITLDPDGGNVVRLATGIGFDPSWSPDGTQITFMCGRFNHADVCVVDGDGSGLVNLTNSERIDWSPSWSPDGSRIIWAPEVDARTRFGDLRRMRADGSATTRVTETRRIDEYEPDWIILP